MRKVCDHWFGDKPKIVRGSVTGSNYQGGRKVTGMEEGITMECIIFLLIYLIIFYKIQLLYIFVLWLFPPDWIFLASDRSNMSVIYLHPWVAVIADALFPSLCYEWEGRRFGVVLEVFQYHFTSPLCRRSVHNAR